MSTEGKRVTIIVPVYGDWPSLEECISSLIKNVDSRKHKVMLVNDCGPEADLMEKNIKKAIKSKIGFEYHRNSENLGFVGNCNRAVEQLDLTDNDVLLLNSDTATTGGFIEEMLEVLYAADQHGVVSPRSNNATLATVPLSAAPQKGIEPSESYKLFKEISPKMPRFTEVPVGHGFCMLTKRALVKKYGLFDTVFGKGYGEEVDYCMRIKGEGYISVLANRAYVFHMEARSFSMDTKKKLLEINNKIIWERYPGYRELVRDYMCKANDYESSLLNDTIQHRLKKKIQSVRDRVVKR
jgi:GT2 family glycosyltransferase